MMQHHPLRLLAARGDWRTSAALIAGVFADVAINLEVSDSFQAPTLHSERGVIKGAGAIARYVARLAPAVPLMGANPAQAARVEQWLSFCSSELDPLIQANVSEGLARPMGVLDRYLMNNTYLVGNHLTLADITVASSLVYARRLTRTLPTHVNRWFDTCSHREEFAIIQPLVPTTESDATPLVPVTAVPTTAVRTTVPATAGSDAVKKKEKPPTKKKGEGKPSPEEIALLKAKTENGGKEPTASSKGAPSSSPSSPSPSPVAKAGAPKKPVADPTIAALATTTLDYFWDTYQFQSTAVVLHCTETCVVLDRTIFHPQGGGQPSDVGVMRGANGVTFTVSSVKKVGLHVLHTGVMSGGALTNAAKVDLEVDESNRRLNARLHSAGHLLDVAMEQAGFSFKPTKGYHFPDGPYVEYVGKIAFEEKVAAIAKVQACLDRLIHEDHEIIPSSVEYDDIQKVCGDCPSYMPKGEVARVVVIGSSSLPRAGCPCGGTHVKRASEIGKCTITAFDKKKKNIRVKYNIRVK